MYSRTLAQTQFLTTQQEIDKVYNGLWGVSLFKLQYLFEERFCPFQLVSK